MNWFDGNREDYACKWFKAMEKINPDKWKYFKDITNGGILLSAHADPKRVNIIISGGGSDGPLFPGFVGEGLADACVIGAPYSAPNAFAIYETGIHLGKDKGTLLLYNNFSGDFLNNDMAEELMAQDGVKAVSVAATDDMGSAIGEDRSRRGGRCALPLMIKMASKCAHLGMSLEEIRDVLQKVNERTSTLSVVIDPDKNQVSFGNGFSGEPGFKVGTMGIAEMVDTAIGLLLEDLNPRQDEQLVVVLNRLRLTSYGDSYYMTNTLLDRLSQNNNVMSFKTGTYNNILDAYGYTITISCLDSEIQKYAEGSVIGDGFTI